jgi:ATP-dependent DNA ligase
VLGVDGIADFGALYSRRCDDQVQLYAFDVLAADGDDLRKLPAFHAQDKLGAAPGASA